MAITSQVNKVIGIGNGVTVNWPFAFPVLSSTDLQVIWTNAAGVETMLAPAQYSLSSNPPWPNGATVTYPITGTPLSAAERLTIVRVVPYTQPDRFSNQGSYLPQNVENRFDLVYMAIQQIAEIVGRVTVSSISNPATEQSNLALIQALQVTMATLNLLTADGDLLTRQAGNNAKLARGADQQILQMQGIFPTWSTTNFLTKAGTGVRQTVQGGPVAAATGLPSFLPAVQANLLLSTQNLGATPLVLTSANGSGLSGNNDTSVMVILNQAWPALTANRAAATPNYLYATLVGSPTGNGTATLGSTLLAPIYQEGGVPSVTSGQFTFNTTEMKGYMGNGATAPQANVVFLGEASTDATTVIATVAYAYNGSYDSAFTATLPAASTSMAKNHNIGVKPGIVDFIIENTTAELAFSIGDQVHLASILTSQGSLFYPPVLTSTAKLMNIIPGNQAGSFTLADRSTGVPTQSNVTLASWKYKFIARRGW